MKTILDCEGNCYGMSTTGYNEFLGTVLRVPHQEDWHTYEAKPIFKGPGFGEPRRFSGTRRFSGESGEIRARRYLVSCLAKFRERGNELVNQKEWTCAAA
jgi:hypothetical protein